MNKRQKEALLHHYKTEEEFLKELEKIYQQALNDINDKIKILQASDLQSKIYQRQYQEALKGQIEAILEMLHSQEYTKIEDYLEGCYRDGFIGALYDLQGQNVPLIMPIDQEQVVKALQLDTQISQGMYKRLGEDISTLKKTIAEEISRGISASMMYKDIARNISDITNIGYSNAKRIVVTEGHRIQNESALECARQAKKRGADSVKVWDSTLDGKIRSTHRQLDGQIKEIEEPFEVAGKKAMFPGDFGDPAEDCNCRCALLQKAKWMLDEEETKYLGNIDNMKDEELQPLADKLHISVAELRSYSGQIIPVRAKSYEDFKRQYNQIWHYEGSDLQKEAEARIVGYKSQRVRLGAQKKNDMEQSDVIKGIKDKVNKAVNKANEHSPLPLSKLSGKYKDDIQRICDHSPDNIKKLYGKYENKVRFINEKQLGTAAASKKGIGVNFKNDSTNERGAWTTTFHEMGHRIERAAGNAVEKYPDFKKSLVADFSDVVNNYQKIYNVSKSEAYKSIGSVLEEPKYHFISDLVGGMTNNECLGSYGHDKQYWSKPYKLEREAFAHFYEATARNDSEKLDAIKAMFPSAYAMFERMVDEI